MRRIIRNTDTLDTRNESTIQNSLYSQNATESSSAAIATDEVTSAIKSSSDRIVNSVSDLGSKISGLDNMISSMSNGSMFSSLEDRKRFSNKEGSGINTLARSSSAIEEKSPLAVRNSLGSGDSEGYMQTVSYLASPGRKRSQAVTESTLNDISKTLKDISGMTYRKNNTLDKISKILDDKLDAALFSGFAEGGYGPNVDLDLPDRRGRGRGRNRTNRSRPSRPGARPKPKANMPRGGRFGLPKGVGAGAGILAAVAAYGELAHFAIDQTAEGMSQSYNIPKEEAQERVADMYNQGDMDYSGEIEEGMENLQERLNAPEGKTENIPTSAPVETPKSSDVISKTASATATQSIPTGTGRSIPSPTPTTTELIKTPASIDTSADTLKENVSQTRLLREEVTILRGISKYFTDKRTDERFQELENIGNKRADTSTGSTGASLSPSSPTGAPTATALPIEGMGANPPSGTGAGMGAVLPSGPGEPGIPDTGGMGGGGAANPTVQGYLSIMQKNAQGSTYSQPNRQGRNSYDCSSFVSRSLQEAGFDISPDNTTSSLPGALRKIGFQYTALPIPSGMTKAPAQLQPGDILLNPGSHVETYAGNNQIVGAHSSSSGVSLKKFYSTGYPGFWRLGGGGAMTPAVPAGGMVAGTASPSMANPTGGMGGVPTSTGMTPGGMGGSPSTPGMASPTGGMGGIGEPGVPSMANPAGGTPPTSTGAMAATPAGSFGSLLSKYETGGKGTSQITNSAGDKGGASYGKFQLSHKMGSLKEYMGLLQRENPQAYAQLVPLWGSAGQGKNGAFGQKWRELASQGQLQKTEDSYARKNYMQGGMSRLRDKGLIQRINANPALQEVFLSTAVQHGAGGGASIWNKAANSGMTDEQIIQAIYAERGRTNANGSLAHFSGNSASIQRGVANRFKNEVNDALALNAQFKSGNYTGQIPGGSSGGGMMGAGGGGNLNTSPQMMDPNVGRFSPDAGGGDTGMPQMGAGDGGVGGGSSGGGGGGSEIPSFINDITLMALQTQLMYDQ